MHLLEDATKGTFSHYLDLNARDSEGTTPICFAYRANSQDCVEYLMKCEKINLDILSPKYGCPLHLCILKHKFG